MKNLLFINLTFTTIILIIVVKQNNIYQIIYLADLLFTYTVVICLLLLFTLKTRNHYSFFFVLFALMFHYSHSLLRTLGLEVDDSQLGWLKYNDFTPEIIVKSILLSSIGISSLTLGICLGHKKMNLTSPIFKKTYDGQISYIAGIIILLFSLPAAIFFHLESRVLVTDSYMNIYSNPEIIRSVYAKLSKFLLFSAFFLLLANKYREKAIYLSLAVFAFYAYIFLYLGSRHFVVFGLIGYIYLWHNCYKKINFIKLLLIFLLLITTIPLIGYLRLLESSDRLDIDQLIIFFGEHNPLLSLLRESGVNILNLSWDIKNQVNDLHGLTYLSSILQFIPQQFLPFEKTIAGSWIMGSISLEAADDGQGTGYSFIAEAYENFGILGVASICITLGYFLEKFSYKILNIGNKELAYLTIALCIAQLSFYVRDTSAYFVRFLFLIIFFGPFFYSVLRSFKRKHTNVFL